MNEDGGAAVGAAAVVDDSQHFFVGEELVQVFGELLTFQKVGKAKGRTIRGNLIVGELCEIIVGKAFVGSFGDGFNVGIGAEDHDHASELAFIFVEIFLVLDGGANTFALYHAAGAGSPGFRVGEQCDHIGRGHAHV